MAARISASQGKGTSFAGSYGGFKSLSARNRFFNSRLRHLTPALSPVAAESEKTRTIALFCALGLRKTSPG